MVANYFSSTVLIPQILLVLVLLDRVPAPKSPLKSLIGRNQNDALQSKFNMEFEFTSSLHSSTSYFKETDHRSESTASTEITAATHNNHSLHEMPAGIEPTGSDSSDNRKLKKPNPTEIAFQGWKWTKTKPNQNWTSTFRPRKLVTVSTVRPRYYAPPY
jgi:hypothetical protein